MSELGMDRGALDRARLSRDPRFDGRFFIAVTSTGIYCRPICPVPSPNAAHVRYYPTAAAAAEAGFRPCLRCRPEAAPGTPAWLGTSAVVRRALRLIEDGALDETSVDALARRLGIGARHLNRLFLQHVGASPVAVAQTRRLHFAKTLLDETDLPITQIALTSGYGSVRRFNEAFRRAYRRAPGDLRRHRRGGLAEENGIDVVLRLAFRPPYDWPPVRDFLAARAVSGVERVDERGYARTVVSCGRPAVVCIRLLPDEHALELRVRGAAPEALMAVSTAARRTFDLAADPAQIALSLRADPLLAPLVTRWPGLRIPGAWDPFECAVRAVLGQQVSVAAARTLAGRLGARFGRPIEGGGDGLTHVFPTPATLARVDLGDLGLTRRRAVALRAVAVAVAEGAVDFGAPVEDVAAALASLPGVADWTAQYVALRGLGEPDAFPAADLVLRRAGAGGAAPLTARALHSRAEAWRPWRGYAALYLWRAAADGQSSKGAHPLRPARRPTGSSSPGRSDRVSDAPTGRRPRGNGRRVTGVLT
jgi:AraC family transcriptional regulator of adaptative response / DNA-3-methyladenine glycosylase II